MNYPKKNILNPQSYEENPREVCKLPSGAISTAFDELDGILNDSALIRDYMECAEPDFNAKKEATQLLRAADAFKPEEARRLAGAFRDIASRLSGLCHRDRSSSRYRLTCNVNVC